MDEDVLAYIEVNGINNLDELINRFIKDMPLEAILYYVGLYLCATGGSGGHKEVAAFLRKHGKTSQRTNQDGAAAITKTRCCGGGTTK